MRDAAHQQAVAATLPQRVRTALPENQPQELLYGVRRAGLHQPEHGGSRARRGENSENERECGKKVPGQGKKKRQREMKTEKTAKACDSIIIKNIENGTEKEKRERRAGRPR